MRKACFLFCAIAASEASLAGGFALIEQGASGLGNAYAGAAAVSRDASTVWFNPAGMTELKEKEFLGAGHVIGVNSDFSDSGTRLGANLGLTAVPGAADIDAGGVAVVPNLYYVHPLKGGVTLGVGLSVPFGNSTDYDKTWVGRYQAAESSVTALDINPSISYRVNDNVNVGAGISIQSMTASLGSAVDAGAVCGLYVQQGALQGADCANAGIVAAANPATDGLAVVEGDGAAVSFNLGLLIKPKAGTKIGLAYRHNVDHKLKGTFDYRNYEAFQTLLDSKGIPLPAALTDAPVTAEASLPPSFMFSASHMVADGVELLADATFTGWSSFQELRVVRDNVVPADPDTDTVTTFAFEDSWRVSAGVNYEYSDNLMLRAGVAYDEDPVPSVTQRTARIPGNERTWVSVGLGYRFNSKVAMDLGFAHLMIDDTPIDRLSEGSDGSQIRGVFESNANILSAQVTVQFD